MHLSLDYVSSVYLNRGLKSFLRSCQYISRSLSLIYHTKQQQNEINTKKRVAKRRELVRDTGESGVKAPDSERRAEREKGPRMSYCEPL
ncbi:hypothetical protein BC939DRAFT_452399 [Gamsiella multidivaricata]|uniref:uncharacterized protein n=1 Tax=Gamsiella multidivaricata TaxID=101098 RepID=UPI0022203550|nr:uncharacterized protein BC939DRAFT_452399 [Gamsiella multidivaricata]KAI7822974.1 hypothetical protein BC939DRAFT_452399 [Gamsiella multidivaricata]